MDQTTHYPEEFLPHWAIKAVSGELVIGAQLPTKDGRQTGNAHIIGMRELAVFGVTKTIYVVLTDAGSQMALTAREIEELFYPPKWVSDISEVINKFQLTK